MHKYDIDGGFPIRGKIKASGNKNAALPCIAAVILTDEIVELNNIPDIEDVRVMVEILKHLGCSVEKTGKNSLKFQMLDIKNEVPESLASVVRASILLLVLCWHVPERLFSLLQEGM